MGRPSGTYGGEYRCIHIFVGKLKEKENLKVSEVDENIILKYILTKSFRIWASNESVWLRIRTGGGLLRTPQ